MTQGRTILLLATLLASVASVAQAQTYSREEVTQALLEAESLRLSLLIEYEATFPEGKRPEEERRVHVTRLTDGQGRFRQETIRPPDGHTPDPILQTETWDGNVFAQEFYVIGKKTSSPHDVILSKERLKGELIDPLGPFLGLRCPKFEKSVGQLLSDPEIPAEIQSTTLDGLPIVEVKILGPAALPNAIITFRYDPQQHWLVREWEMSAKGFEEGKAPLEGPTLFISRNVNGEFRQVGDLLMPGRCDNYTTMRPGMAQEEKYHQITFVTATKLNPPWTESDFVVDTASLPLHSQMVDSRWGGTYRLGEDVVLLQGRLHQLLHVVNAPIDPDHFDEVLVGSTPVMETGREALATPGSSRSLSDWLRLVGYGMVAVGGVGAVVLFFRYRFGAS